MFIGTEQSPPLFSTNIQLWVSFVYNFFLLGFHVNNLGRIPFSGKHDSYHLLLQLTLPSSQICCQPLPHTSASSISPCIQAQIILAQVGSLVQPWILSLCSQCQRPSLPAALLNRAQSTRTTPQHICSDLCLSGIIWQQLIFPKYFNNFSGFLTFSEVKFQNTGRCPLSKALAHPTPYSHTIPHTHSYPALGQILSDVLT